MKPIAVAWMFAVSVAALLVSGENARAVAPFVLVDNGGASNNITKYDYATGNYLGLFTTYSMVRPVGMTVDPAGNVYVADITLNTIEKFDLNGTHLATFTSPNINDNEGMVVSNGFLYSASYGNGIVEKFSLSGTDLGAFTTVDDQGLQGMAADASGNLYVADYNGHNHPYTVQKINSSGTVSQFASLGTELPIGLALDSGGDVYASAPIYAPYAVHKFNSAGLDIGDIVIGQSVYYLTIDQNTDTIFGPKIFDNVIELYGLNGTDYGIFTNIALDSPVAVLIVPEPASWGLFAAGAAALAAVRRRKSLFP